MTRDYYVLFGPSKLSRLEVLSEVLPEVEQLGDPMINECYELEVDPVDKDFREAGGPIVFQNLDDLIEQTKNWQGLSIPFDCALNDKFVNVCTLPNDNQNWLSIHEIGSRIERYYWHDAEAGPRWLRFLVTCAQKVHAEYFVLTLNHTALLTADEFGHCVSSPLGLFGMRNDVWEKKGLALWKKPAWGCEEKIDDYVVVYSDDFGKP